MKRALATLLLLAAPAGAAEVVEISRATGTEELGVIAFCSLATRADRSTGYALVALGRGGSLGEAQFTTAVGMSPGEPDQNYGELLGGTVRHVCGAGGAYVLAVTVDFEAVKGLASLMPRKKELRKESPYTAASNVM
ncbi:MAG: hypothetical protein R3190_10675, partial [Thermoanaerobaculia bacterium]|nr:hypothetical protein [Thermoanaerobaculia bacterium]